jgi:proline dehydrogenase
VIPPIANRFVAGEEPAVALEHARRVNADGIGVILNALGEHHERRADAEADAARYRRLLADVEGSGLRACVSVKPTQLGLEVDRAGFEERYRALVAAGADRGIRVWCDMEDATTTDATIDAFERAAREHPGTAGLCLQANLRRTPADVDRLAGVPGRIRLVKGAYDEGPAVAHTEPEAVDEAYLAALERLVERHDGGVAVGSHDPRMIERGRALATETGADVEFQLLMGVREPAQRELAAAGHEVWQYAPFGRAWLDYFVRRVRERRRNAVFAARAVVGLGRDRGPEPTEGPR